MAENRAALAGLNGQWIDPFHDRNGLQFLVLDMDSSFSPTHGDQQGGSIGLSDALKNDAAGQRRCGFAARSDQFQTFARPQTLLKTKKLVQPARSGELHVRRQDTWGMSVGDSLA